MNSECKNPDLYIEILKEELIPAMGCTEPIALAYAAAKAKELLPEEVAAIKVGASGSIIKNVKAVVVPNTGGLIGIAAAVVAGVVAGNPDKKLEVISQVAPEKIEEIKEKLKNLPIEIEHLEEGQAFDILVTLISKNHRATARIVGHHTNLVFLQKDEEIILELKDQEAADSGLSDRSFLSAQGIWNFVKSVDVSLVQELLEKQIEYNMAIAQEGLENEYGVNIGKILLETYGDDIWVKLKAYAAAGSDARMSGCEMPVIINSGSGNQGIATSVPVIVYAQEKNLSKEELLRGLCLANLLTIYQKGFIGRLSAFCGVVSAGASVAATIAYLNGCTFSESMHALINSLAVVSGMVCDGAKPSCAGKIAAAIESGLQGLALTQKGKYYKGGEGLVDSDIEKSLKNFGNLGRIGMQETNETIIKMMIER